MYRDFEVLSFRYFERRQLEEYLNDYASKGWYLKEVKPNRFRFVKEEHQNIYYHVDVFKKKNGLINVKPQDDYYDYFEENGYHFLHAFEPFYIFTSSSSKSIHTDDVLEEESIKHTSHRQMTMEILVALLYVLLIIIHLKYFVVDDLCSYLSLWLLLGIPFYIIGIFIHYLFPYIAMKSHHLCYHYTDVFKREYLANSLIAFSTIMFICCYCHVFFVSVVAFVFMIILIIFSRYTFFYEHDKRWLNRLYYLSLIVCLLLGCGMKMNGYGDPSMQYLKQQDDLILMNESQSPFFQHINYQVNDERYIDYYVSYYSFFNDWMIHQLVNQDFIQETKGNMIVYMKDDDVVVQKENAYLTMSLSYYENGFQTLQW